MARARTAKQKMALKKAQIASARKRKGTGKAKPVGRRRRVGTAAPVARRRRVAAATAKAQIKAKSSSGNKRKIAKRVGVGAAIAVAAVGAGATVYKNREKLIVEPMAQRRFIKAREKELGRKLTKSQKRYVAQKEKKLHARRSVDAARAYLKARNLAKANPGKSLSPDSNNSIFKHSAAPYESQRYIFELYRKDVNARARARHTRMQGKKTAGFGYNSGKQVKVTKNGKVVRQWW